jgi:cell shape-determining protein MreD
MEKAPHPLNPLLKMKILATQERMAQAIAAMMAVIVTKLPGTKKTFRRLTLRARNFRNIRPSWLFLYICTFT